MNPEAPGPPNKEHQKKSSGSKRSADLKRTSSTSKSPADGKGTSSESKSLDAMKKPISMKPADLKATSYAESSKASLKESGEMDAGYSYEPPRKWHVLIDGLDLTADPQFIYSSNYVCLNFCGACLYAFEVYGEIEQTAYDPKLKDHAIYLNFVQMCGAVFVLSFGWMILGLGNSRRLPGKHWQLLSAVAVIAKTTMIVNRKLPLPDIHHDRAGWSQVVMDLLCWIVVGFGMVGILIRRALGAEREDAEYQLLRPCSKGRWGPDDIEALRRAGDVRQDVFKEANLKYLSAPGLLSGLLEMVFPRPFAQGHNFRREKKMRKLAKQAMKHIIVPPRVNAAALLSALIPSMATVQIVNWSVPLIWDHHNRDGIINRLFAGGRLPSTWLEHCDYIILSGARCILITACLITPVSLYFCWLSRRAFKQSLVELLFSSPRYKFHPEVQNWRGDTRFVGIYACMFVTGHSLFMLLTFTITFILSTRFFWNWLWSKREWVLGYIIYFAIAQVLSMIHARVVSKDGKLFYLRRQAWLVFMWEILYFPLCALTAVTNAALLLATIILMLMRPDVKLFPLEFGALDMCHDSFPSMMHETMNAAIRNHAYLCHETAEPLV